MEALTDLFPGPAIVGRAIVVVALLAAAYLVRRAAGRIAAFVVDHSERNRPEQADTAVITGLRQRETAIGLAQTTIGYLAFGLALVLAVATLLGAQRVETVVGASFLAVLIAFAFQRFLMDVIAGLLMWFEGWFRVGDTVRIEPWDVQGVVERVSVRAITVRGVDGQVQWVPNSSVQALKVLPRGYREFEVELFVRDGAAGRELVEQVGRLLPVGATNVVRRPRISDVEELDGELTRITIRLAVAPGREWLAEGLFHDLLKERANDGLLVHGPVVLPVDDQASQRFARAVWTDGGRSRQAPRGLSGLRRMREAAQRQERPPDYP